MSDLITTTVLVATTTTPMIHLCLSPPATATISAVSPPLRSGLLPSDKLLLTKHHPTFLHQRKLRNGKCRAEFSADAPISVAIGACVLSSLVFPMRPSPEDEEEDDETSLIDTADTRYAVMAIISFIPYFNWMSWVFAWMDTGRQRYLVYAIVYLAPYLRSNLSLSPEESWLPIASILLCIFHVQLESSIKNGDIQGFRFLNEMEEHISSIGRKIDSYISKEEETVKDHFDLPPSNEHSRDELRRWGTPKEHSRDIEELDDNAEDANSEEKR